MLEKYMDKNEVKGMSKVTTKRGGSRTKDKLSTQEPQAILQLQRKSRT